MLEMNIGGFITSYWQEEYFNMSDFQNNTAFVRISIRVDTPLDGTNTFF